MENIIYLDESAVNEELITHYGGELEETISRINTNTSLGGEVGGEAGDPTGLVAKLKAAISANYERGKEKEFVYNLTDEVAKFSLLLEVLDASGATSVDHRFTSEERDSLAVDSPVMITAPLIRTPIAEIREQFDINEELGLLSEGFGDLAESGLLDDEDMEELQGFQDDIEDMSLATSGMKKMFSSLSDKDDIYRTSTSSEVDFVMGLPDEKFKNRPFDFPNDSKQYVIIGKIMTKVDPGDRVPLINFAELAEKKVDNSRNQKKEEMTIKSSVSDLANSILKREVSPSEFELSHPDVQIRPLAIY